jgi:hypothetical protein
MGARLRRMLLNATDRLPSDHETEGLIFHVPPTMSATTVFNKCLRIIRDCRACRPTFTGATCGLPIESKSPKNVVSEHGRRPGRSVVHLRMPSCQRPHRPIGPMPRPRRGQFLRACGRTMPARCLGVRPLRQKQVSQERGHPKREYNQNNSKRKVSAGNLVYCVRNN